MPQLKNPKKFGDLMVKVNPKIPKKLSKKAKDLFSELKQLGE
jgi:DnaJ-class molecular chaperone